MDPLSLLLDRLSIRARLFFSGSLCGQSSFDPDGASGHLHLLRSGRLEVRAPGASAVVLTEPALILFARPTGYTLHPDPEPGADLVCANIDFEGAAGNPLLIGFPDRLIIPLDELRGLGATLDLLFEEAFMHGFGHRVAVDRLLEVLMVLLLRHCMHAERMDRGVLAAFADPRLAKALQVIHESPERLWSLESLADTAGMSRASFASQFKTRVGVAPGDYLATVRLALACKALRAGAHLKRVASQVGYSSAATLSRAFKQRYGCTPRDWLEREQLSAASP